MSFESQKENDLRLRSREAVEAKEVREGRENDAELKRASSLEKADIIVKEVKSSKKQMQNIVLHMQQVTVAIRQLRVQLQLAQTDDDVSSVKQDSKRIEDLRVKIKDYVGELEKMSEDLVREQMEELKDGIGVGLSAGELRKRAEEMVEKMIVEIKQ